MEKKQRSLALAGAGIAAAAALGLTGATLAGAAEATTAPSARSARLCGEPDCGLPLANT